LLKKF